MLRCLLLDDELPGLTYLKMLCEQLPNLNVVKAFNDAELFLKEASHLEFDFCIADIQMPKINGMQVAGILKHKPFIFATAYSEFAAEAYDLDVVDYIRKPIQLDRLQAAIKKIEDRLSQPHKKEQSFTVNTDQGKSILYFKDLLYISASNIDSRDKEAFLSNRTSLIMKNLNFEKLQQLLPGDEFVRINKKQVLAKKIIKSYSSTQLISTLTDSQGKELHFTLSDSYRDIVLKSLQA